MNEIKEEINRGKAYRQDLIDFMKTKISSIRKDFFPNIDQSKFAEYIGLSRQTFGNIENGKKNMTSTQYIAICSLLDQKKNYYIRNGDKESLLRLLNGFNKKDEWINNIDNYSDLYKYSFLDDWMKTFSDVESKIPYTKKEFIKLAKNNKVELFIFSFNKLKDFNNTMSLLKELVNKHDIYVYVRKKDYNKYISSAERIITSITPKGDLCFDNEEKNLLDIIKIKAGLVQFVQDGIIKVDENENFDKEQFIRILSPNKKIYRFALIYQDPDLKYLFESFYKNLSEMIQQESKIINFSIKNSMVFKVDCEKRLPTNEDRKKRIIQMFYQKMINRIREEEGDYIAECKEKDFIKRIKKLANNN